MNDDGISGVRAAGLAGIAAIAVLLVTTAALLDRWTIVPQVLGVACIGLSVVSCVHNFLALLLEP